MSELQNLIIEKELRKREKATRLGEFQKNPDLFGWAPMKRGDPQSARRTSKVSTLEGGGLFLKYSRETQLGDHTTTSVSKLVSRAFSDLYVFLRCPDDATGAVGSELYHRSAEHGE